VFTRGLRRAAQAYVGSSAMARAATSSGPRRLWTRERVIDELRARAREGLHTMTSALYHHSRELFGGAREARIAANAPEPAPRAQWSRPRTHRGPSSCALEPRGSHRRTSCARPQRAPHDAARSLSRGAHLLR
jgi:hypothetical protein